MYRIGKTFEIQTGHILSKHKGACRFPHGHSLKVEVVLESPELNENQMVCDFAVLKEMTRDALAPWDHALLMNTDDPNFAEMKKLYGQRVAEFKHCDPTSEVLAKTIFETLNQKLQNATLPAAPQTRVAAVRVWETSGSWAEVV